MDYPKPNLFWECAWSSVYRMSCPSVILYDIINNFYDSLILIKGNLFKLTI